MVVELPGQLWNNLVDVLSHLTPWKQVIVQWTVNIITNDLLVFNFMYI